MNELPTYQQRGLQSRMSRRIAENHIDDSSDSDDDNLLNILQDETDDDFKPVKSQPGLYYKVSEMVTGSLCVQCHDKCVHTRTDRHPILFIHYVMSGASSWHSELMMEHNTETSC